MQNPRDLLLTETSINPASLKSCVTSAVVQNLACLRYRPFVRSFRYISSMSWPRSIKSIIRIQSRKSVRPASSKSIATSSTKQMMVIISTTTKDRGTYGRCLPSPSTTSVSRLFAIFQEPAGRIDSICDTKGGPKNGLSRHLFQGRTRYAALHHGACPAAPCKYRGAHQTTGHNCWHTHRRSGVKGSWRVPVRRVQPYPHLFLD